MEPLPWSTLAIDLPPAGGGGGPGGAGVGSERARSSVAGRGIHRPSGHDSTAIPGRKRDLWGAGGPLRGAGLDTNLAQPIAWRWVRLKELTVGSGLGRLDVKMGRE